MLHRQTARLLALENAIDVAGCLTILVEPDWPVGEHTAGDDERAIGIDHRQAVVRRDCDERTICHEVAAEAAAVAPPRTMGRACGLVLWIAGLGPVGDRQYKRIAALLNIEESSPV